MDKIDKLIAQSNGSALKLPPYWRYKLQWVPITNGYTKVKEKNGRYIISTQTIETNLRKPYSFELDYSKSTFNYDFYYEDPNESEAERDQYIFEREFEPNSYIIDLRGGKVSSVTTTFFPTIDGHLLVEPIKFELKIINRQYIFKPYYDYRAPKVLVEPMPEPIKRRKESLIQSILNFMEL